MFKRYIFFKFKWSLKREFIHTEVYAFSLNMKKISHHSLSVTFERTCTFRKDGDVWVSYGLLDSECILKKCIKTVCQHIKNCISYVQIMIDQKGI